MRALYTVQELADALRLQPGTVRNKLWRGEDLPRSVRVKRRRLFSEEEVERWLQEQFASGATAARIEEGPERCLKGPDRPRRPPATPTMLPTRGRPRRRTGAHQKQLAQQFGLFTEGGRPVRRTLTRQNEPRFSNVATGQFSFEVASQHDRATGTVPELSQIAQKATIQKTTTTQAIS